MPVKKKPTKKATKKPSIKIKKRATTKVKAKKDVVKPLEKVQLSNKSNQKAPASKKKTNTLKEKRREKGKTRVGKEALKNAPPLNILLYPHLAEKSMNMIDMQNMIVFVVNPLATKNDVKRATESLFKVKVVRVNIEVTPAGMKKAYIKLHPDNPASEIASRLGVM